MLLSFFLGFVAGVASLLGLGVILFLSALDWIERQNKKTVDSLAMRQTRDLVGEPTIDALYQKQGLLWILEREKNSKVNSDGATVNGSKEKKEKNNVVEVSPVKKHARITRHTLILAGGEGPLATIDLSNCTVISISSSNNPSRKWAKRFPIKIQSKEVSTELYNGNNSVYLYADTSSEKESWCKALRLACTTDPKKLQSHSDMVKNFQNYLEAITSEYPSFIKNISGSSKQLDCANRADGQSRVRNFFKRLSKRGTAKMSVERTVTDNLKDSSPDLTSSPEAGSMVFEDDSRLCLNLLLSRFYFDLQESIEINNLIQSRLQSTLSGLRIPSYIGEITCTGFSLGRLSPHIHKIRAVPVELSEVFAFEVDFDLTGGFLVSFKTMLDIHVPELQNDLFENHPDAGSSLGSGSGSEEEGSDHLGLENRRQCRSAYDLTLPEFEAKEEAEASDGLKHSKSTNARASMSTSRWKNMLNSIATRVNQVPLSLAIRVNMIRGTLRCHIKPPPSDRLWYGFTSMPDIDWNIETSIAEHKIASKKIASLLKNRFKASLFGTMVLPNCENIHIPGMLSEKDDWAPSKTAPFMWVKHETTPDTPTLHEETEPMTLADVNTTVKSNITPPLDEKVECGKDKMQAQESKEGSVLESYSSGSYNTINRDWSLPSLKLEKQGSSASSASSENMVGSPVNQSNLTRDLSAVQGEDPQAKKVNRRARMVDFKKRMGDKLGENRKKFEEKSRTIVEKLRENMNTVQ